MRAEDQPNSTQINSNSTQPNYTMMIPRLLLTTISAMNNSKFAYVTSILYRPRYAHRSPAKATHSSRASKDTR